MEKKGGCKQICGCNIRFTCEDCGLKLCGNHTYLYSYTPYCIDCFNKKWKKEVEPILESIKEEKINADSERV